MLRDAVIIFVSATVDVTVRMTSTLIGWRITSSSASSTCCHSSATTSTQKTPKCFNYRSRQTQSIAFTFFRKHSLTINWGSTRTSTTYSSTSERQFQHKGQTQVSCRWNERASLTCSTPMECCPGRHKHHTSTLYDKMVGRTYLTLKNNSNQRSRIH